MQAKSLGNPQPPLPAGCGATSAGSVTVDSSICGWGRGRDDRFDGMPLMIVDQGDRVVGHERSVDRDPGAVGFVFPHYGDVIGVS